MQKESTSEILGSHLLELGEYFLPEALLHSAEVGRLPAEGGAMHPSPQGRKPLRIVASEVLVDGLLRIHPEELTRNLHREDLTVIEKGLWSAGAQWLGGFFEEILEVLVYEAEDGYNKEIQVHGAQLLFGKLW